MRKATEIFIFISIITIGLILIWALVGCKDKADSLDFIPTWPEYIELEKTLHFEFPDNDPNDIYTGGYAEIGKGTKIYFKD